MFIPKTHEEATMSRLIVAYRHPQTDFEAAMAVRNASNPAFAVRMWLDRQANRLNEQALTQRKWQRNSRRLGRANHHDSVETREKYVRGYMDTYPIPTAYKGVYRGVCRIPECPHSAVTEYFLCRKHRNASVNSRV